MNVSPEDRRQLLKLYNVSEAARILGIRVRMMHSAIRAGRLPVPSLCLGKRRYFTRDDMDGLQAKEKCQELQRKNHP